MTPPPTPLKPLMQVELVQVKAAAKKYDESNKRDSKFSKQNEKWKAKDFKSFKSEKKQAVLQDVTKKSFVKNKKPEIKPKPTPKPKVDPKKVVPVAAKKTVVKEQKIKEPEIDFTSVLKSVEDIKKKVKARKKPKKPVQEISYQVEEVAQISSADEDRIRKQFIPCWNVLGGARDADKITVDIEIRARPDGTISEAVILDKFRAIKDPVFRAAAASALRAVKNPKCQPLNLPKEKYRQWQKFILRFNPRDMF